MAVDGRELLVQLRRYLSQIENRLIDIEAWLAILGGDVANKPADPARIHRKASE
jgi:hypothetical protein